MPRLSKIGAAALAAFGWTTGGASVSASYLVVAGGGSGGGGYFAGGGGAGGLLTGTASLNPTLTYTITIGAGAATVSGNSTNGLQGSNTTFSAIATTAVGGGYGAGYGASGVVGGVGGSGGGTAANALATVAAGTSGQGNAGGQSSNNGGGGGGGAGSVGGNAGASFGTGGTGSASSISGASVTYAAGAAGGITGVGNGASGTANTGNGGAASSASGGTSGQGGSGIVIISYVGAQQFSGGVVTSSGGNTIHTFNTSGTLGPVTPLSANYLVVAGGAGGGGTGYTYGGGGGAGGFRSFTGLVIDPNTTYLVTVGAGGAAGVNGSDSFFSTITSTGGGRGGEAYAANTGGSGGGGGYNSFPTGAAGNTPSTSPSQGNSGGNGYASVGSPYTGGGGGGAGAAGSTYSGSVGGAGGIGATSSISGTSTYYAGGGGGASGISTGGAGGTGGGGTGSGNGGAINPIAGTANTGGGGGGGGYTAAAGGSGVVIISYAGSTQLMAGGVVTIAGGNVIHTFNSSGYLTPLTLLTRSLRFRSSASAYLNRTPATASNRTTWTWSGWVKRGTLGVAQALFSGGSGGNRTYLFFNSSNGLEFHGNGNIWRVSTNVYRDPSAWYHIVWVLDTNNATAQNRTRIYINNVEITSWSTNTTISSGATFDINAADLQTIGRNSESGGTSYLDGYLTEVNFIDGQALAPTAFGTFNSYGVWQPITYGGSYGTNGFRLPFNSGNAAYAGSYSGSNYIYAPDNSAWAFTGNYTLEAYFYVTTTSPVLQNVFAQWVDSGGTDRAIQVGVNSSAQSLCAVQYGANQYGITSPSGSIKTNTWYHVAMVLNGTTLTLYLNGVSQSSTTVSGTLNNSTAGMGVGAYANGSYPITGAISNARITNTAVYTANFTPSTANLTAITGTQLLTLQNSTIIDNSTNAFSLTNVGSLTTGQTYPFAYTIFNDQSPQGNNWTPNNISGLVGSTLDYMTDVPTLYADGGNGRGNYCTLNPLSGGLTPTNGNLSCNQGSAAWVSTASTFTMSAGKWYFEIGQSNLSGAQYPGIGLRPIGQVASGEYAGSIAGSYGGIAASTVLNAYSGGTAGGNITASYTAASVFQCAVDFDAGKVWFGDGTSWIGGGSPASGTSPTYTFTANTSLVPYVSAYSTRTDANFGQRPFTYTPPTGYLALNTFNL